MVPLLDESALHSCGDALERLRGIARLVLRKLTVPVFAPVSGAAAAAGAGGDAGGEVGEAAAAGAAGAAATQSDKGGAAALDVTQPRQQRSFWQVRHGVSHHAGPHTRTRTRTRTRSGGTRRS